MIHRCTAANEALCCLEVMEKIHIIACCAKAAKIFGSDKHNIFKAREMFIGKY